MNVYDSKRMADLLSPLNYKLVDKPDFADLIILNTCHIREKAEQKVYSDLGRLKPFKDNKENDKPIIAVGGCVGQAEGVEIIRNAPYVDIVFGPQTYHKLPEMIAMAHRARDEKEKNPKKKKRGVVMTDFPVESKFDSLPEIKVDGPSAFLSIQEGCDKFCTFCVVPYTRGAEFSRSVSDIVNEAKNIVSKGVVEISLLGQNVNAYHGDSPTGSGTWNLGNLIEELSQIDDLKRIRYTTSHPRDMHEDLYIAHKNKKLMPHLHLPVQSGSDSVLKSMNRKHTAQEYLEIIRRLKELRPGIVFSSDFIIGFPGESDKDFEDTLNLVREVNYSQAYSFKYSPRPGTPGAAMDLQVPEDVKDERLQIIQALLNEQQIKYNESCVGSVMSVLLERKGKREGQLVGRSDYMQSVYIEGSERLLNKIVDVKIKQANPNSLVGEIVTVEEILTFDDVK
jgi:tRNA-2-methylthio-N6-dimethylallyladenosine synthase